MKRLMESHWRMRNQVDPPWMEKCLKKENRLSSYDLKQQLRFIDGDTKKLMAATSAGMKMAHEQRPLKRSMSAGSLRLDTTPLPQTPQKQIYRRTMDAEEQDTRRNVDPRMCSLSNSRSVSELESMSRLARCWVTAKDLKFHGKIEKLEELYQTELALINEELGPKHPDTSTLRAELAMVLRARGGSTKLREAEWLLRLVSRDREERFGIEHPATLTAMNNLAIVLEEQYVQAEANNTVMEWEARARRKFMQKLQEAESLLRKELEVKRRTRGGREKDTLATVRNLVSVLQKMGSDKVADVEKLERLLKVKKVRSLRDESYDE